MRANPIKLYSFFTTVSVQSITITHGCEKDTAWGTSICVHDCMVFNLVLPSIPTMALAIKLQKTYTL